jgi:hypothetical protein
VAAGEEESGEDSAAGSSMSGTTDPVEDMIKNVRLFAS